jgi:hypothetical protein
MEDITTVAMSKFVPKYRDVILNVCPSLPSDRPQCYFPDLLTQRMFVVGETTEASEATTTLIEKIVRGNIINMV